MRLQWGGGMFISIIFLNDMLIDLNQTSSKGKQSIKKKKGLKHRHDISRNERN